MDWNKQRKEELARIENALKTMGEDKKTENLQIKVGGGQIKVNYKRDGIKFFITLDVSTINCALPTRPDPPKKPAVDPDAIESTPAPVPDKTPAKVKKIKQG
jgi:hypothetical protein